MPRAVQLYEYGGLDQLRIVDKPRPKPDAGEVLVRTVAAGTNPGEIALREGQLKDVFPMDFPFGQGTDFAGRIDALGAEVAGFTIGDAVLGWSERRSAHADYVSVPASQVVLKPPSLDWYRAGSLFGAGVTAFAAVRAVSLHPGDVVAISAAAGGVGSFAVQLAVRAGARVIGIASAQNAPFLRSMGAEHVAYGDDLAQRLRAATPNGLNAFIDLFGHGYVDLAVELGVGKERIDTIIDFDAAAKHGVKTEACSEASDTKTLRYMADLVAWGEIVAPIAAIYPFDAIHDAYVELARRKAHGKIVLDLSGKITKPLRPRR